MFFSKNLTGQAKQGHELLLDTDDPGEIEKENALHWAGKDCQDF